MIFFVVFRRSSLLIVVIMRFVLRMCSQASILLNIKMVAELVQKKHGSVGNI